MQDMSDMMYNNEEYASGLSSDEINNLIMEEEATRENAERLLLMDTKDEKELLNFVANLDKVDAVTGTVEFDVEDTLTSTVESANYHSALNSEKMGAVEIHELCNFKCGRKEGQPRWMCKCLTIVNYPTPLSTTELEKKRKKDEVQVINATNMLKKRAVEAFDEHMEMERAVEAITFPEEELHEDVDYDGDNDDEIDFRNIDGMELESSSEEEVQQDDDSEWENEDGSAVHATVTIGDIMQLDYENEEAGDGNESSCSHGSFIPIEDLATNVENSGEQRVSDDNSEDDEEDDDTDDEEKFILYHLVTNGDSGYEKVELNLDILQQAVGLPTRNDFPNIVDLPTWPNCCVESQSHKKCQCGEFVKQKVVKLHKELVSLYGTRQHKNATKRLEYNNHDADLMINTRLERLEELKNVPKVNKPLVKKKTVVKKKTTWGRRIRKTATNKRKRTYEIHSDLVFHEEDFCNDVEGRRGKSFACPICQEPALRKTNAMQHAVSKHHCTVMRLNKEKRLEKFVLDNFRCMHEDCFKKHRGGKHSFKKYKDHMSTIHSVHVVKSETTPGEYYIQDHESCIIRELKHGCDRDDCYSYDPCESCKESYGCSDMTCGCWHTR